MTTEEEKDYVFATWEYIDDSLNKVKRSLRINGQVINGLMNVTEVADNLVKSKGGNAFLQAVTRLTKELTEDLNSIVELTPNTKGDIMFTDTENSELAMVILERHKNLLNRIEDEYLRCANILTNLKDGPVTFASCPEETA